MDAVAIHTILATGQDSAQNFIDDNNIDSEKLVTYLRQNLNSAKKYDIRDLIKDPSSNKKLLSQFVKESVNEDAMAALFIFLQTLMMSGPVIALGIKQGVFDDWKTPTEAIRDWKKDRIVSAAVERLNQDHEVIEFLQLPGTQQRGKWQKLIASKLNDKELKHINSISRYKVKDLKSNK